MAEQHDVVFIADRVTLLGFKPLGVGCISLEEATTSSSDDPSHIKNYLRERLEGTKLVVVSHEARIALGNDLEAVTNPSGLPLVVTIPGALGARGDGGERIRRLVERAMGADLFGDEAE